MKNNILINLIRQNQLQSCLASEAVKSLSKFLESQTKDEDLKNQLPLIGLLCTFLTELGDDSAKIHLFRQVFRFIVKNFLIFSRN